MDTWLNDVFAEYERKRAANEEWRQEREGATMYTYILLPVNEDDPQRELYACEPEQVRAHDPWAALQSHSNLDKYADIEVPSLLYVICVDTNEVTIVHVARDMGNIVAWQPGEWNFHVMSA